MNKRIKRHSLVYMLHGLMTLLVVYNMIKSATIFGKFSWTLLLAVGLVSFANVIINKYYIEIVESKLVIHQDHFRTKSISLTDIEKIDIEPGPFKSSSIFLKDKTKVKFNDNYIDVKELKEIMGSYNIPVT